MSGAASNRPGRSTAIGLAISVAASTAAAQDDPPALEPRPALDFPPASAASPDLLGFPVHGSLSLRYLLRNTSADTDQDLYGFLDLDMGDPERHLVTAHLLTKAAWDVDGDIHHTGASTFDSLEDTYDDRLTGSVYELYGEYHGVESLEIARFGRQILDETPVQTYLDGLRFDTAPQGERSLRFGAYAGVPAHLYESSPEGDLLFGAFGEARPHRSNRTRLDWMQVQDDYLSSERLNALVRLATWQQLGESLAVHGSYSMLDWESRDLDLRGSWMELDGDTQVEVGYYQLLQTQQAEAIEFDPFFDVAGEYNPFRELRASASRGFGDHFTLAAGATIRRLVDDDDEGTFNHDFERWYLEPSMSDWPIEGMTIAVAGELWDDGEELITTVDATVDQQFTEETKGHVGTTYSLYKYDFLTASERDHVRTWFVGVETRATKAVRLRFDYVYEIDAFDHYNTFRAAATWTF